MKTTPQADLSGEEINLKGIEEEDEGEDEGSDTSRPPMNSPTVVLDQPNLPQPVGSNAALDVIFFFTEIESQKVCNVCK